MLSWRVLWNAPCSGCCSLLVPCSQVLFLHCLSSFKVGSLFHQPNEFCIFPKSQVLHFTNISMYLIPCLILQWIFIVNWWRRIPAGHLSTMHNTAYLLSSWHQFTPLIDHRLVTKAIIRLPLSLKVAHSVYRTVFTKIRVRQTMTIVLFMASYVGLLNRQSSVSLSLEWVWN